MSVGLTFYDSFTHDLLSGAFNNMPSLTLYMMILDNTYTPSYTTHTKRSDLTGEVSGTGYVAGGQALGSLALSAVDTTNHLTNFTAANAVWNPVTFTNGRYGAIYQHHGGGASSDELVCLVDFGANQSPAAQSFSVQWNASGVFALSRA
jgi:hypothetical protein